MKTQENPIELLNPITDEQAAASVSVATLADLMATAMEIPPAASRPSRKRRTPRVGRRRPRALVLTCAAAAGAAVLGVLGAIDGHSPGIAQPADAAILRRVDAVLHPASGSIVIQAFRRITRCELACRAATQTAHLPLAYRFSDIAETVGERRDLTLVDSENNQTGVETAELPSGHELYVSRTNTIYRFSYFGYDIKPGLRPGTFVYRLPSGFLQLWSFPGAVATVSAPPLTISQSQAEALRVGTASIAAIPGGRAQHRLQVRPAPARFPYVNPSASARADLGSLRVAGRIMLGGHPAIKLVPRHGAGEFDVALGSGYPLREIEVTRTAITTTSWSKYDVLPDTAANQALLSLARRHPSARIVENNHAYWMALRRFTRGD